MAVTLDIDGSIQGITTKLKTTRDNLEGVAESYDKLGEASKKAIGGAANDQDDLAKGAGKAGKALKDQRGIVEKLEDRLKSLQKGQKKATDVKTIKKYNVEIAKTQAALNSVGKAGTGGAAGIFAMNTAGSASIGIFNALKATLATTFAPILAAGAALAGISEIIGAVSRFEQTTADLSAITGATGDALDFLKQSAIEVGVETTASAEDTLEAYKLIASAKPELLSNAEGLAAITRSAVKLNEAIGGELPNTSENLTGIMNQFSAEADQAERFVNALAAGSKAGSADVNALAETIKVAGVNMSSSNVAVEEGIGLAETLAEKNIKGAEAGTGLRNVLSKLSATEILPKDAIDRLTAAGVNIDALSDKNLTFSERLEQLKPIQEDANALTALFGLENQNVAKILIDNTDKVNEYTAAVTDTNVAQEQAETRTATLAGNMTRLKNTITAVIQGNGGGISTLLSFLVSLVRSGVLFLNDALNVVRPSFEAVGEAVGDLFSAIGDLLPATDEAAGGISFWDAAVQGITIGIRALLSILTFAIGAITGTVQAINGFIDRSSFLQNVILGIRNAIGLLVNGFLLIPNTLDASLAAAGTFFTELFNGVKDVGGKIGTILKEAFSFKKIFTEGTGDLNKALEAELINPFAEAGKKAKAQFLKTFATGIKVDAPEITQTATAAATQPDTPTGNTGGGPSSFNAEKEAEEARKKREKAAKEKIKLEQDIARATLDAMKDGVEKQLALEDARFKDLKQRLVKYGIDTTEATYQNELNKFEIKSKFLKDAADLEGLTGEERVNFLFDQTKAEIDAVEQALRQANGGELLAEQVAQLNLLRKQATDEYLNQITELQSKEQQAAQQQEILLLELKRDGFDSQKDFEEFKQKEILDIKLRYAEEQLALVESVQGAESAAALSLRKTINDLKGDITELQNVNVDEEFSFYKLLGLDPNDDKNKEIIAGIETAASSAIDILGQLNDIRLESAEQALKKADEQIEKTDELIEKKQEELDEQTQLAEDGFSSDQEIKERELIALQEQKVREEEEQKKALEQKKKIQKEQARLDTITQGISLITAAAKVFNSVAAIPFAGPVIGAGLVAAMLGSFIAAKRKVFSNIDQLKAEKGTFQHIGGERHVNGGTDLGYINAEKGEGAAVYSRKAMRGNGKVIEMFTNAANRGDRATMQSVAEQLAGERVVITNTEEAQKTELVLKEEAKIYQLESNKKELTRNNELLEELVVFFKTKKEISHGNGVRTTTKGTTTKNIKRAR